MSNKALKTATFLGLILGASSLAGCSSLGGLSLDRTATSSVSSSGSVSATQPMPQSLGQETAFVPPNNIGAGGGGAVISSASADFQPQGSVSSQDLPALPNSSSGSSQMLPAAQPLTPAPATQTLAALPSTPAMPTTPATPASGNLVAVPSDAYVHVIESGESLYTVARKYNVTAQAIIQANGFSSPDKIYVGQKIIIPGRADLLSKMATPKVADVAPKTLAPSEGVLKAPDVATKPALVASIDPKTATPLAAPKPLVQPDSQAVADAKPLVQPKVEPTVSGADKFRWPVSGRVTTDFASSKGTGINIEATEGTAVRAAENGQVIYAGSGVEGYGNLILIRHPNGYVSAYAHLKDMSVAKGTVINRGDIIGTVGKTGSVAKAQLHFELRKGATPVDPIPLLAS